MNVHPARAVEREFAAYYKSALDDTLEFRLSDLPKEERTRFRRRQKQLHPSSFPYCGYRHAYEFLTTEKDPVLYAGFGDDYYLGVGTLTHTALQKWLGRKGQVAGDWKCNACGHVHEMQVLPKKCKACGSKTDGFEYEEVGGVWGSYIWWHKDGIFVDRKGRLWIIDYKTTSTNAIWQHKKKGDKFPYKENKHQAEAYVVLAEDKYKKPIHGWILFYASRDYPSFSFMPVAQVMTDERKEEIRARLKANDRTFKTVLGLRDNPQHIGRIRNGKLCSDRQFYRENVHHEYRPCPLYKHCFKPDVAAKVFANAFKGIPIAVKKKEE